MRNKNLGDLIHEALEEYNQPQGKLENFKGSLEHFIAKNRKKLILGTTLASAGVGYYVLGEAGGYVVNTFKLGYQTAIGIGISNWFIGNYDTMFKAIELINQSYESIRYIPAFTKATGILLGAGIGFLGSAMGYHSLIGKGINSKIKNIQEKSKKKIGKIFRYPKLTALALTPILGSKMVMRLPDLISNAYTLSKSAGADIMSEKAFHLSLLDIGHDALLLSGVFGTLSFLFYIARDLEHIGKQGFQNIFEAFRLAPTHMLPKTRKIRSLEKAVEKRGTYHAKQILGKVLLKENGYEGLKFIKTWINESDLNQIRFSTLRNLTLGSVYSELFKKKEDWVSFYTLLGEIRKSDKEATKIIINKVRKTVPQERVGIHLNLNFSWDAFIREPQPEAWREVAINIRKKCVSDGKIKEYDSSEGKVYSYTGDPVADANILLKDYPFNFIRRFLKQKYEHDTLERHPIKTENPLAFQSDDKGSWFMVIGKGETTLRKKLENADTPIIKTAFDRVNKEAVQAQKILYKGVKKDDSGFYVNVEYENKTYKVSVSFLDLHQHLLQRAFIGDERRKDRFGNNEYLDEVLKMIAAYRFAKYSPMVITMNHGDLFLTNLTDKFARFDPRHIITEHLYDSTYVSFDLVFLRLNKEKKEERVFQISKKEHPNINKDTFMDAFDYFYLHNGLGLAASQRANNKPEIAEMILAETIDFAGKEDEALQKTMLKYLRNSKAKELLKNI